MRRSALRRNVLVFVLSSLLALVLLSAAGIWTMQRVADQRAEDATLAFTRLLSTDVADSYVTDAVVEGDPAALAALDEDVRTHVLGDAIVRIKVWAEDGRVVYSDEQALIGQRFELTAEERELFVRDGAAVDHADLGKVENGFEQGLGRLVEVYVPMRTEGGTPLLFEIYGRHSAVAVDASDLVGAFVPVAILGLLLLWAVQVPLAWRLARRVEHAQSARAELAHRVIDASDEERRRIARELDATVGQDLASLAFSLSEASARRRDGDGGDPEDEADMLGHAATSVRRALRQLRHMLGDIAPPDLSSDRIDHALAALVAPLGGRGIESSLEIDADLDLPRSTQRLVYLAAREALRDVERRGEATAAHVRLRGRGDRIELEVDDDGPRAIDETDGDGGVVIMRELAAQVGGRLDVHDDERGRRLVLDVPRR